MLAASSCSCPRVSSQNYFRDVRHGCAGVFAEARCARCCCDRWSTTPTGDTMSGVARDVAAGAAKPRRDRRYRTFWRHELMGCQDCHIDGVPSLGTEEACRDPRCDTNYCDLRRAGPSDRIRGTCTCRNLHRALSSDRVRDSCTCGQLCSAGVRDSAPSSVIEHVALLPAVTDATPAPVIECVASAHAATFAPPAPVTEHVAPASSVTFASPAPVVEDVAPAPDVFRSAPTPEIENLAPTIAVTETAPNPGIVVAAPAPAVTCSTPDPETDYVTHPSVMEYIAPAPSVTFATPTQLLPPAHTMAAVTTCVSLDTTGVVCEPPRKKQCTVNQVPQIAAEVDAWSRSM